MFNVRLIVKLFAFIWIYIKFYGSNLYGVQWIFHPLKKNNPQKKWWTWGIKTARRVSGFHHTQTLNICQTQCQNISQIELSNKMSEYQNICQLKCQIRYNVGNMWKLFIESPNRMHHKWLTEMTVGATRSTANLVDLRCCFLLSSVITSKWQSAQRPRRSQRPNPPVIKHGLLGKNGFIDGFCRTNYITFHREVSLSNFHW